MNIYSNSTLKYMGKNFLKSMGILFIPSVLLGIFLEPMSLLDIIVSIGRKEHTYNSFLGIFKKINGYAGFGRLVIILFIVLLTIVTVSIVSGYNRQNMRYGAMSGGKLKSVVSYLNDNFIPVLKYALFLFVSVEIVAVLLSTFMYTAVKMFANALPACIVLAVIFLLLELYLVSISLLAIPNMTMKGYGLFKSLGQSVYELSAKSIKLFFSILWIILLLMLPTMFVIIFPFKNAKYLLAVLSCIFYWVFISYLSVMTYVVYFDVEELEREDLKV